MHAKDISPPDLPRPVSRVAGVALAIAGRKIAFIHTESGWRDHLMSGHAHFPAALMRHLARRGYAICFLPYGRRPYLRRINKHCLHIYLGPGRGHRGQGILTLHPAYVSGYWYLDPMGHRERSSIVCAQYDQSAIEAEPANALFGHVRRASVKGGWTTREQPEAVDTDLPEGAIVIALQRFLQGKLPKGAICSEIEMIRAVAAARGRRPVLIKYHPFGVNPDTKTAVEKLCRAHPDVTLVDVNIHDLLKAASVVCCFSSGVGFEAMLHRVPTLLFATADYHHAAFRVPHLEAVPDILKQAAATRINFPKYVYWLMTQNLFHAQQVDLESRLDSVLGTAGDT